MPSETVTLKGHILDTLSLPRVLDEIVEFGADYEILDLQVGIKHEDTSFVKLRIRTEGEEDLARLLDRLQQQGANADTVEDAELIPADVDGAFPAGFYSSTNRLLASTPRPAPRSGTT